MTGTSDDMIAHTKRKKKKKSDKPSGRDAGPGVDVAAALGPDEAAAPDGDIAGEERGVDKTDIQGAVGGAGKENMATCHGRREANDTSGTENAADSMALVAAINDNPDFHTFGTVNTQLHACGICKRHMLGFAAAIHHRNIHEVYFRESVKEDRG
jgi:hypothetical protein